MQQLPSACADCHTVVQPAAPGAPAAPPVPWKMAQAPDGKTRLDFGQQSLISNPATGEAILLDHVKKEAVSLPVAKMAPPALSLKPGGLPAQALPMAPPPSAQDLGKKLIDGHEVQGKLFTLHPPPAPAVPQASLPGLKLPASPKAPQTVEMWTSTQLHMPVLTTVSGSFGKQITRCKCAPAQHPPSMFQIPSGYKVLGK